MKAKVKEKVKNPETSKRAKTDKDYETMLIEMLEKELLTNG